MHSTVQLQEPKLDYADVSVGERNQPAFVSCNKTLHLLSAF